MAATTSDFSYDENLHPPAIVHIPEEFVPDDPASPGHIDSPLSSPPNSPNAWDIRELGNDEEDEEEEDNHHNHLQQPPLSLPELNHSTATNLSFHDQVLVPPQQQSSMEGGKPFDEGNPSNSSGIMGGSKVSAFNSIRDERMQRKMRRRQHVLSDNSHHGLESTPKPINSNQPQQQSLEDDEDDDEPQPPRIGLAKPQPASQRVKSEEEEQPFDLQQQRQQQPDSGVTLNAYQTSSRMASSSMPTNPDVVIHVVDDEEDHHHYQYDDPEVMMQPSEEQPFDASPLGHHPSAVVEPSLAMFSKKHQDPMFVEEQPFDAAASPPRIQTNQSSNPVRRELFGTAAAPIMATEHAPPRLTSDALRQHLLQQQPTEPYHHPDELPSFSPRVGLNSTQPVLKPQPQQPPPGPRRTTVPLQEFQPPQQHSHPSHQGTLLPMDEPFDAHPPSSLVSSPRVSSSTLPRDVDPSKVSSHPHSFSRVSQQRTVRHGGVEQQQQQQPEEPLAPELPPVSSSLSLSHTTPTTVPRGTPSRTHGGGATREATASAATSSLQRRMQRHKESVSNNNTNTTSLVAEYTSPVPLNPKTSFPNNHIGTPSRVPPSSSRISATVATRSPSVRYHHNVSETMTDQPQRHSYEQGRGTQSLSPTNGRRFRLERQRMSSMGGATTGDEAPAVHHKVTEQAPPSHQHKVMRETMLRDRAHSASSSFASASALPFEDENDPRFSASSSMNQEHGPEDEHSPLIARHGLTTPQAIGVENRLDHEAMDPSLAVSTVRSTPSTRIHPDMTGSARSSHGGGPSLYSTPQQALDMQSPIPPASNPSTAEPNVYSDRVMDSSSLTFNGDQVMTDSLGRSQDLLHVPRPAAPLSPSRHSPDRRSSSLSHANDIMADSSTRSPYRRSTSSFTGTNKQSAGPYGGTVREEKKWEDEGRINTNATPLMDRSPRIIRQEKQERAHRSFVASDTQSHPPMQADRYQDKDHGLSRGTDSVVQDSNASVTQQSGSLSSEPMLDDDASWLAQRLHARDPQTPIDQRLPERVGHGDQQVIDEDASWLAERLERSGETTQTAARDAPGTTPNISSVGGNGSVKPRRTGKSSSSMGGVKTAQKESTSFLHRSTHSVDYSPKIEEQAFSSHPMRRTHSDIPRSQVQRPVVSYDYTSRVSPMESMLSAHDRLDETSTSQVSADVGSLIESIDSMVKDLELTLTPIGSKQKAHSDHGSFSTTEKRKRVGSANKSDSFEKPVHVQQLNNDIGIPKGDIMISLLSENIDTAMEEAVWRCRTMRQNSDTKWLRQKLERQPNTPSKGRTSVLVDVDDVRVVGGMESVAASQKSALEHLKYDDLEDALHLWEDIVETYYTHFETCLQQNTTVEQLDGQVALFTSHIASCLHNIGIIYLLMKKPKEAYNHFERAAAKRASSLGVGHTDHLVSYTWFFFSPNIQALASHPYYFVFSSGFEC